MEDQEQKAADLKQKIGRDEMTTAADFRPTHVVPRDGLPAWEAPDVNRPTAPLDALLPVQLVDRLGDWARIVCANDWSAWVDGRLLIAVPADPPAAGHPLTRTADPAPLLARTEEALSRYRRATEELASGALDGETFRSRTRGQRVGVVVDGESMWLYDADHERWVHCDGTRLSAYATGEGPSAEGGAAPPGPPQATGAPSSAPASSGPADGTGPAEPAQVVEAAQDEGGGSETGSGGASSPAEPTQVVGAGGGGAYSGGAVRGPEPTRVVEAAQVQAGGGDEPARWVQDASGGHPDSGHVASPAEPTQVVEAAQALAAGGEESTRRVREMGGGDGADQGGAISAPEPTQVVEADQVEGDEELARWVRDVSGGSDAGSRGAASGPESTQVVEAGGGVGAGRGEDPHREDSPAPASYPEEATRRIPPVTGDRGAGASGRGS
ncbi:hypothetical protein ACWGH5_20125 [Streptomyces sp. NPDC054864]